jgi:hypothetical protein
MQHLVQSYLSVTRPHYIDITKMAAIPQCGEGRCSVIRGSLADVTVEELYLYKITGYQRHTQTQIITGFNSEPESFGTSEALQEKYSKFKHGSVESAEFFADDLADLFSSAYSDYFTAAKNTPEFFVTSSGSMNLLASANLLQLAVLKRLNLLRYVKGLSPIPQVKVFKHKDISAAAEDFAKGSQESRDKICESCTFSVDCDLIEGKHVLVIDDCRLGGTVRDSHIKMFERCGGVNKLTFAYIFADDTQSKGGGKIQSFENYINQYSIKPSTLDGPYLSLMQNPRTYLTNRSVKFFFDTASSVGRDETNWFLSQLSTYRLVDLYYSAVTDGLPQAYKLKHFEDKRKGVIFTRFEALQAIEGRIRGHELVGSFV